MMAMAYGNVYVAQIAMGASDKQTLQAFIEAEAWEGPSLIIAYSHCIAHGIDMTKGLDQQKLAVDAGAWPLFRYDPQAVDEGRNPLKIDSKKPKISIKEYALNENRYRMLMQSDPARAEELLERAQRDNESRWTYYQKLAEMNYNGKKKE